MAGFAWIQAATAAGLIAGAAPAPVSDPARLAALLENPARRGAAFCELLRLQRYRGTPRYHEDVDECEISHVVVAPQRAGAPMYLVFRRNPEISPEARLGDARGPFVLIDSEGYIIPAYMGADMLGERDELLHYAGDARVAIAQVMPVGGHDVHRQELSVIPISPEQRALFRVVVGPAIRGSAWSMESFTWTWAWRSPPGLPPVLQLGPRASDGQLASVAAEFTYSASENRYIGPPGGATQGFLVVDPQGACCAPELQAFKAASIDTLEAPQLAVEPARREVVTLCAPGTDEHRAAQAELAALDRTIAVLGDAPAQLEAANQELSRLLGLRCFRMSQENPRSVVAQTGLALRTWWKDGGERWLRSYLSLRAESDQEDRQLLLPPDMRPALEPSDTGSGLLVCKEREPRCGEETRGWQARATARLADLAAEERLQLDEVQRDPVGHCWDMPSNYFGWRVCTERARPIQPALPLGHLRAPARGWLVVAGRRGHHDFCDTLRAYDLATGTAYGADSCSGLVLVPGGTVDQQATDARRQPRAFSGRMPLDHLREAAWMAVLADDVEPAQITAQVVKVPAGMKIEWLPSHAGTQLFGGSGWGNSGQTTLRWWWVDAGSVLASGELTWPSSCREANRYAVELLQIAEEGLIEGPPRSALPAPVLDVVDAPHVSRHDATRADIEATSRALRDAVRQLASRPRAQRGNPTSRGRVRPSGEE